MRSQAQVIAFSSSNRSCPACHNFSKTPAATPWEQRAWAVDVAHNKECRSLATRFEKLAVNYLQIVKLAFIERYLRLLAP
jgi:hypothetical protein